MTKQTVIFRNCAKEPNKTIQCHDFTILHFLFLQYNLSFFSASFTCLLLPFLYILVVSSSLLHLHFFYLFMFFLFFNFPFHPCVVHSLSTLFHLEAMYSQFVFQLNKKYVPQSFILLCRSASDVVERPGSITVTFKCFSTSSRPRTFL
jgi:hypothetical protein